MKRTREIHHKVVDQKHLLQRKHGDLLYKKLPFNDQCCTIGTVTLLGSVLLEKSKLLHIYDERHLNDCIILTFVNCHDSSTIYWTHRETIENVTDPAVMSEISMAATDGYTSALFAVGRKVFIAKIGQNKMASSELKSVSPILIREVAVGSWITNVAVHYPDNDPNDEFVISVSNESLIREYNTSGIPLRVINTDEIMHSSAILKVAYCKTKFAVVFKDIDEVIMIDTSVKVKRFSELKLKPAIQNMFPIKAIWTGNRWVVLFVKEDAATTSWKIVDYIETMGVMSDELCDEGSTSSDYDIPVSVTRYRNTGYLTFGDSSVRTIQF